MSYKNIRHMLIQKKKRKKHRDQNYIDALIEWEDNQYVKGYYSGGKIPPFSFVKHNTLDWLLFFLSGIALIVLSFIMISGNETNLKDPAKLMMITIIFSIGVISFYIGISKFYKFKKKSKKN